MAKAKNILSTLKGDRVIWAILVLLSLLSILVVYSATDSLAYKYHNGNAEYYLAKQSFIVFIGFVFAYFAYATPYQWYKRLAPWALVLAGILLVLTMVLGVNVNSARRWLTVPLIGATFQASDFAKLALVLYVAKSITDNLEDIKDLKKGFAPVIVPVLIICGLIAPSDLSTAIVLFTAALGMMFVARVRFSFLFTLVAGGVVLFSFLVTIGRFFPDLVRVDTWVTRMRDFMSSSGEQYQVEQAKMAIANGHLFGQGPGNSILQDYLPSSYADFVYAIITEEYGLIGAVIVLLMYVVLMFRVARLVTKSPRAFGSMLAVGLGLIILVQALANMAVSVNLLPVTGLPLPLVSKGGSSTLITAIEFGMILSVSRYIEELSSNGKG